MFADVICDYRVIEESKVTMFTQVNWSLRDLASRLVNSSKDHPIFAENGISFIYTRTVLSWREGENKTCLAGIDKGPSFPDETGFHAVS